jgi:hypothetical protein
MNNSLEHFFSLKVVKADGSSMTYRFTQKATAGSDPRNDIILGGAQMQAKHLLFKQNEHCLSLTFLGKDHSACLNQIALEKNKMYIVEKKDSIQIGLTEIIIL